MDDVEYGRISDFYLPPAFLHFHDGPSINVENMWPIVGCDRSKGAIKPKNLQPKPSGEACYSCWMAEEWQDTKQTMPIISGDVTAPRLPALVENLGHSNVILTGGGSEAWKHWKAVE